MTVCGNRGKSKAAKRPFMKLFTSDYRDGTASLSFELQGFYFRILTYLHDGEAVPADPAALARFLHCQPRTTRAFLPKLIEAGKLYEENGLLRNRRVDRDLEPNSSPTEAEFGLSSSRVQPEFEPNSGRTFEKPESNQYVENCTMEEATSISNSIPEPDTKTDRSEKHAANGPDEIPGLNGSTSLIITTFAGWMNPWAPDLPSARKSISDAVGIYGDRAVRDAFAELKADIADNRLRVPTVKAFYGYCRTAKERGQKPTAQAQPPSRVMEVLNRRSQGAHA